MSYYLVKGSNGIIIKETYEKALRCQKYITHSTTKKFTCFREAEQAAFDHLNDIVPYYIPLPDHIEVNEMITISKLDKTRKENQCSGH